MSAYDIHYITDIFGLFAKPQLINETE